MADRQVWVYRIPVTGADGARFMIPAQARLVHAQQQHDGVSLWYEVDLRMRKIEHRFQLFGTGQDIPDGWSWRATGLFDNGHLVLHVYEADRP